MIIPDYAIRLKKGGRIWLEWLRLTNHTHKVCERIELKSNLPRKEHSALQYCIRHEWHRGIQHIPRLLAPYFGEEFINEI